MKMKYTCDELRELLSLYIDDLLEGDEISNVEEHLSLCSDCQKLHKDLLDIKEQLGDLPEIPLPVSFDRKIHKVLKAEGKKIKGKRYKFAASIAAVLMVGLISVYAFDSVDLSSGGNGQALPSQIEKTTHQNENKQSKQSGEVKKTKDETSKEADITKDKNNKTATEQANDIKEKAAVVNQDSKAVNDAKAVKSAKDAKDTKSTKDTKDNGKKADANKDKPKPKSTKNSESKTPSFVDDVAPQGAKAPSQYSAPVPASAPNVDNVHELNQYLELINQQFYGQNYKIQNYSQKNNGAWTFNVFILNKNDDTIVDRNIEITGQGGNLTIWDKN